LQTDPPPLPQASRKRILPAFLLCVAVCGHRIYAGRYVSGIIQIACAGGAFFWLEASCRDLMGIIHSASFNTDTIERISDWEQTHGLPVAPMFALIAVGIWIAIDAGQLIAGRFADRHGQKITRWL
jgi:hypothetical protein